MILTTYAHVCATQTYTHMNAQPSSCPKVKKKKIPNPEARALSHTHFVALVKSRGSLVPLKLIRTLCLCFLILDENNNQLIFIARFIQVPGSVQDILWIFVPSLLWASHVSRRDLRHREDE